MNQLEELTIMVNLWEKVTAFGEVPVDTHNLIGSCYVNIIHFLKPNSPDQGGIVTAEEEFRSRIWSKGNVEGQCDLMVGM